MMQPSVLMCSDDSSFISSADDHDVTLEEKLNKDSIQGSKLATIQ